MFLICHVTAYRNAALEQFWSRARKLPEPRRDSPHLNLNPVRASPHCHGVPMSSARMTIDGLWRCLCPSVDGATLTRAISAPHRCQLITRGASSRRSICARSRQATTRSLSTTICLRGLQQDGAQSEEVAFGILSDVVVGRPNDTRQVGPSETKQPDENPILDAADEAGKVKDSASVSGVERPVEAKHPERKPLSTIPGAETRAQRGSSPATVASLVRAHELEHALPAATTEDIYDALRILRDRQKSKDRNTTTALVKHLLASGMAPNTLIYETLLVAHAAPDGSADTVKALLREMQVKMLPWSSTAYHAALRVGVVTLTFGGHGSTDWSLLGPGDPS